MATTTKDPVLQERARLVRLVESNLKVSFLDAQELRFRGSLLRKAAAELPGMNGTQVTRLYEAACDVKFPSDEVTTFRATLQRRIGTDLNLKEFKA
jgi:hypothetical protein